MHLAESLLVATCALAAIVDHRRGLVPTSLTLGACIVALCVHAAGAFSIPGNFLSHLGPLFLHWAGGAVLTALVPLFLWKRGSIGGGDVKLFAAIGAFLGPTRGLEASLYAFCVGCLAGIVVLARDGALGRTLEHVAAGPVDRFRRLFGKDAAPKAKLEETWMRFGPAIFVGTCVALFLHGGGR